MPRGPDLSRANARKMGIDDAIIVTDVSAIDKTVSWIELPAKTFRMSCLEDGG